MKTFWKYLLAGVMVLIGIISLMNFDYSKWYSIFYAFGALLITIPAFHFWEKYFDDLFNNKP